MDYSAHERRYDVDWLRVLAFGLLIIYHIGMYYVADWNWHIKSNEQSEMLQNFMLMLNPWRMSLLFFVSGAALSLVGTKYSKQTLLWLRTLRILIPLIIAMYIVVPPQLYFELLEKTEFSGNYWQFLEFYVQPNTPMFTEFQYGPAGLLTWNHLWYLAYIWVYSCVFIAIHPLIQCSKKHLMNLPDHVFYWLPVVVMTFIAIYLKPYYPKTHALFGDWYNHAQYFWCFILGVFFIYKKNIWSSIIEHRFILLFIALAGYVFLLSLFHQWWIFPESKISHFFIETVLAINVWAAILTAVAMAGAYLNHQSRILAYLNSAILPCYILHQTLIIIFAVYLEKFSLNPAVEAFTILAATISFSLVGYEIVKRNIVLRIMFGLKIMPAKNNSTRESIAEDNLSPGART